MTENTPKSPPAPGRAQLRQAVSLAVLVLEFEAETAYDNHHISWAREVDAARKNLQWLHSKMATSDK